jgi:uncharacterized protein YajQ (UPF0234 family)
MVEVCDLASKVVTVTDIGAAIENAMNDLSRRGDDLLETSTAEFDLNGNEIQLLSVDVDLSYIRDVLEDYLMPLGEVDSKE